MFLQSAASLKEPVVMNSRSEMVGGKLAFAERDKKQTMIDLRRI
jgi:hypothetical protein